MSLTSGQLQGRVRDAHQEIGGLPKLERALRSLATATGSAIAASSDPFRLVFDPTSTTNGPIVFNTWPMLAAAASTSPGPKVIAFNGPGPFTIPAGGYDLNGAVLAGEEGLLTPTTLNIADGAIIDGVSEIRDLAINGMSSTSTFRFLTPFRFFITGSSEISQVGAGSLFSVQAPVIAAFYVQDSAGLLSGNVINVAVAGATFVIRTIDESFVATSVLSGIAGSSYGGVIVDASSEIDPTQPGLPAFPISFGEQSKYEQYLPNGAWAGPPPLNVQEAIDRLATAVSGLLGGPIP